MRVYKRRMKSFGVYNFDAMRQKLDETHSISCFDFLSFQSLPKINSFKEKFKHYFSSLFRQSPKSSTNHTQDDDKDEASRKSSSSSQVCEEMYEQHSPTTPNFNHHSTFVSPQLNQFFDSCLPNITKGCQRVLLYSSMKHGISLRTLVRNSAKLSGPALLIVGDREGAVFGGLVDCPLQPTFKRKYQGTNQTFVFTTVYGQPRLFRPTGVNRYYYLCLNDLVVFGGGGSSALCLDGDLLTGTSGPCDTFGNMCLAHTSEFELKNVELWGFRYTSPYLNQ